MRAIVICVVFSTFCVLLCFSKTFDGDGLISSSKNSAFYVPDERIFSVKENSTSGLVDNYTKETMMFKSSQRSLGGMTNCIFLISMYFYLKQKIENTKRFFILFTRYYL